MNIKWLLITILTSLHLLLATNCYALSESDNFDKNTNINEKIPIGDITDWIIWLFFLPGNVFIHLLNDYLPELAGFLQLSANSYDGVVAGIISTVVWGWLLSRLSFSSGDDSDMLYDDDGWCEQDEYHDDE